MSQASSGPAAPPAQDKGQGGGPAEGTPPGVEARFEQIEAEQRRQGSLLEQIAAAVTGGGKAPAGDAGGPAAADASPQSLAAMVRQEIEDADRRRQTQDADRQWRDEVTEVVERVKSESAPREPEKGARATIRRGLFGRDE